MHWKTIEKKSIKRKDYSVEALCEYINWLENKARGKKVFLTCKGSRFRFEFRTVAKNSRQRTIYRVIEKKWRSKFESSREEK